MFILIIIHIVIKYIISVFLLVKTFISFYHNNKIESRNVRYYINSFRKNEIKFPSNWSFILSQEYYKIANYKFQSNLSEKIYRIV